MILTIMPKKIAVVVLIISILGLAGCIANKPKQKTLCEIGNWQGMGYKDGLEGKGYAYIGYHRATCEAEGIQLDRLAYREGYLEGLEYYCTPENGRVVGREGGIYRGVCPEQRVPAFLAEYEAGRKYYLQKVKVDKIEYALNETRKSLRELQTQLVEKQQQLQSGTLSADFKAYTELDMNKIQREMAAKTVREKALLIDYVIEKSKLKALD